MIAGDQRGEGEEGLWDVKDVARYLKASKSWVYQQAEAGLLPCHRMIGLLRFTPSAIRSFAQGERAPAPRVLRMSPKGP